MNSLYKKPHSRSFKPINEVYTTSFFEKIIKEIQKFKSIAVDFEYDPNYRYIDRLCLIQISTRKKIYLIDPLAPRLDIQLIKTIFEDPNLEKVFHDARQDIILLKKAYSISIRNLFDTSVAARYLGFTQPSLKLLLHKFFNVNISKQQSRADWSIRPLTKEMKKYAINDVKYLLEIRDRLHSELISLNALEGLREIFEWLEHKKPDVMEFNPDSFLRIPGAQDLSPIDQAVLKELHIWRETQAMNTNNVAFMILPHKIMLDLVQKKPDTIDELKKILGRQKLLDSHADLHLWAEFYDENHCWIPADPTHDYFNFSNTRFLDLSFAMDQHPFNATEAFYSNASTLIYGYGQIKIPAVSFSTQNKVDLCIYFSLFLLLSALLSYIPVKIPSIINKLIDKKNEHKDHFRKQEL